MVKGKITGSECEFTYCGKTFLIPTEIKRRTRGEMIMFPNGDDYSWQSLLLTGMSFPSVQTGVESFGTVSSLGLFGGAVGRKSLEEIFKEAISKVPTGKPAFLTARTLDKSQGVYEFHIYTFSHPKANERIAEYSPEKIRDRVFAPQPSSAPTQ